MRSSFLFIFMRERGDDMLLRSERRKNMETINGATYYPPVDHDAYDEHELDMYFIGDNYGLNYGEE